MPHPPLSKPHAKGIVDRYKSIAEWITGDAPQPEPENEPRPLDFRAFKWFMKFVWEHRKELGIGKNIRASFNRLRETVFKPPYFYLRTQGQLDNYLARLEKETTSLPTKTSTTALKNVPTVPLPTKTSTTALKDVPTAPLSTRTNKLRRGGAVKRKPNTRKLRKGGTLLFGMKHGIRK
jgi:hypothetical protein